MTDTFQRLKSEASALPAPERAELAYILLSSLQPEEDGARDAWQEEIAHRVAEIRSGSASGRPAEEILAQLRERYL